MVPPSRDDGWFLRLPGFRLLVALWGSLLAVDVGKAGGSFVIRFGLVAAVVAACSLGQRLVVVATVAVVGWLILTGFVVNSSGTLALSGADDALRLLLLIAAAAPGALLGRPPHRRPDPGRRAEALLSPAPETVRS